MKGGGLCPRVCRHADLLTTLANFGKPTGHSRFLNVPDDLPWLRLGADETFISAKSCTAPK
jgi:hypothetical protein